MENLSNQEILNKVQEIVDFVKSTEDYQNYLYLEEKMKKHPIIPKMIEEIKKVQKEVVQRESKGLDITMLEQDISSLESELKDIPLYQDFLTEQEKLNELFIHIKNTVEQFFKF